MLWGCCSRDCRTPELDAYDWDSERAGGGPVAGLVPLDGERSDLCTEIELQGLLVRVLGDFARLDVCFNQFRVVECAYARGLLDTRELLEKKQRHL